MGSRVEIERYVGFKNQYEISEMKTCTNQVCGRDATARGEP